MSLCKEEIRRLQLKFFIGSDSINDKAEAKLFTIRAQIAAQLFVGSVRNETGAAEAVAEADMLLKELLK